MGQAATLCIVLAACMVLIVKVVVANRRVAAARRAAEKERALRDEREQALRHSLERVRKKRDPLEAAKSAIADDPARAAQVVSRMMKHKNSQR